MDSIDSDRIASEIEDAVIEAKYVIGRGDEYVRQVSGLMKGRLRIAEVDSHVLKALKMELRDFDCRTGWWKTKGGKS